MAIVPSRFYGMVFKTLPMGNPSQDHIDFVNKRGNHIPDMFLVVVLILFGIAFFAVFIYGFYKLVTNN